MQGLLFVQEFLNSVCGILSDIEVFLPILLLYLEKVTPILGPYLPGSLYLTM